MLKGHFALQPVRRRRQPWPVMHVRYDIENVEHALAGRQGMLQHVIDGVNLIDRHIKQRQIRDEHHEFADRQMLLENFGNAKPQH